jgi:PAS domain S-box-containing protein
MQFAREKTKEELQIELNALKQENDLLKIKIDQQINLEESEEKYRTLVEQAGDGIFSVDFDGNMLEANESCSRILGYPIEELTQMNITEILEKHDLFDTPIKWTELKKGIPVFEERSIRNKNNQLVYLEISSKLYCENKIISIARDITQRKTALQQLEESEKRFKTIFNDAPLGIALIDSITGKIYEANPMFAKLSRKSMAEMKDIHWMTLTHPDDLQFDKENLARLLNGEIDGVQYEKRYIRPDGSIFWINLTVAQLIKEEHMPSRILCMIEDITQRKLLYEKIDMLSQAIEQSPATVVITDVDSNIEYVNPKFVEHTGFSLHEVSGTNIHRLDLGPTTEKEYEKLMQTINAGNTWIGEFQNKKKDGTVYWESAVISPIKNQQNITTHFLAISEDITERKLMEEKLQKIAWKQSHEIRGPLATLMGIVTVMNYDITLDEKLALLGKLDEAANILDTAIHAIVNETKFKH